MNHSADPDESQSWSPITSKSTSSTQVIREWPNRYTDFLESSNSAGTMPTLKKYVDSSEKTGLYILANVGGNAPVTLQVSSLGETILRKSEYQPEDTVPSKLVWSMHEVGLSYTSGGETAARERQYDISSVDEFTTVSSRLTEAERQQLIDLLYEYSGPGNAQIESLIREIEEVAVRSEETVSDHPDTSKGSIGADVGSIDSVVGDESDL